MSQQDIIRHASHRGGQNYASQPSADDLWMQQQALAVTGGPPGGGGGGHNPLGLSHGGGGGGGGDVQPLQVVHRSLRGRYKLAVLLAAAGALAGTAVGWSSFEKTFRAKGTVRIDNERRTVGGESEAQTEYTRYMGAEANYIKSPEIVAKALKRKEWLDVVGNQPWDIGAFMSRMTSTYATSALDITVAFDHTNPQVAKAAVAAVLGAYADYRVEQVSSRTEGNAKFWQDAVDKTTAAIDDARKRRIELERTGSIGDLAEYLKGKTTTINRLRDELDAQQFILDRMNAMKQAAATKPPVMTEQELARRDPMVNRLFQERDALLAEMLRNQRTFGPTHPTVTKMRDTLAAFDGRMRQIAEGFSKDWYGTYRTGTGADVQLIDVTQEEIATRSAEIEAQKRRVAEIEQTLTKAVDVRAGVDTLGVDVNNLEALLKGQNEKLAAALARGQTVGAQFRTIPSPLVDVAEDKRPTMATFGFVAGGAIPLMGLVLYGLFDRKYRYSDETTASGSTRGVPLLGILPNLPDRLSDPSQASVAAHCVHQIRTMLQLNVLGEGPSVLSVTSATSGDGKTSLSLALGLSFAASGSRTLLVDTDLIGSGLSSRLGIREPQGIGEAVASRDPMSYVRDTDVADLSVLPVGTEGSQNASSFSPTAVRRLIAAVRPHFDIVLIDTGPVLGSIEATPVVAASDAVILTVARGQNRDLVEKAIGHLRAIGARIAGVVFNRANARDFERSISGISLRSVSRASSMNGGGGTQSANGQGQDKHLGPLVHSVRGTREN